MKRKNLKEFCTDIIDLIPYHNHMKNACCTVKHLAGIHRERKGRKKQTKDNICDMMGGGNVKTEMKKKKHPMLAIVLFTSAR